jgi:hypothetical protein
MRVFAVLALIHCLAAVTTAADIKPADSAAPLLTIYEPKFTSSGSEAQPAKAELGRRLLVISSVRDLVLARDNKGVLLGLTSADTKKFSEITRRFDKRYLVVMATDDIMEVIRITAPIEDGYIGFKHPEEAPIAKYLRRRFRIGEFK